MVHGKNAPRARRGSKRLCPATFRGRERRCLHLGRILNHGRFIRPVKEVGGYRPDEPAGVPFRVTRDSRIITGDLRMTKRGRSRTIRETRLGFGETGIRLPGGGSSSHSWGVGRSLPGPALMPGRRSGRARLAPPLATPEPRSRGFSMWGFSWKAQAPTARNPVERPSRF